MEIITTKAPETYYQECCAECGSPLVTTSRQLVCEYCGIVAEDSPFDFHESRANYKWRQNTRDKKLSRNRRPNSIQAFLRYKILNKKIRRSYQRDAREKLFNSEIARLCGQLELPSVILRDAELYANDILQDIPPYTHFDSILAVATALVWGCTFIYSPRTFQEIMSVAHSEVSRSKVLQAANRLVFTHLIDKSPRMLENKTDYNSLVAHYIEHFGAVLNIPMDSILTAKELFRHLGCKKYIIKPDVQSVAFLWYIWTKMSTAKEYIALNEFLDSQKKIPREIKQNNSLNNIKRRLRSISGYEKGHELRSQIIGLLKDQDLSVKALAKRLQKSYHTIYYHIQKLKASGFLSEERKKAKDGRKPMVMFSIKSQKNSGKGHNFEFRVKHVKGNNGNANNGHKNSDMPQLTVEMVSKRCFASKTSIKKVVRAIHKDIKKELNSVQIN